RRRTRLRAATRRQRARDAPGPRPPVAPALAFPPGSQRRSDHPERPDRCNRHSAHHQPVLPRSEGRPVAHEPRPGWRVLLDGFGLFERVAVAVAGLTGDERFRRTIALGAALQPGGTTERLGRGRGGRAHLPRGQAFARGIVAELTPPRQSCSSVHETGSPVRISSPCLHWTCVEASGLANGGHFAYN